MALDQQVVEARLQLQSRLEQAEKDLKDFSSCRCVTDECLDLLDRARGAWAQNRLEDARSLLVRAECRLLRARSSDDAIRRYAWKLGLYECLLLMGLLFCVVLLWRQLVTSRGPQLLGWRPLVAFACWGGLGGAVAALFGLYHHARKRDFDPGYLSYYLIKPVVGLGLGPLFYLLARAGLMAMQVTPDGGKAPIQGVEILYLGAFLLGFGERFAVRLLDRVATAVFGPTEAPAAPAPAPPPVTPREMAPSALPLAAPPERAAATIKADVEGPDPDDAADISATLTRGTDFREVKGPPPDEGLSFVFGGLVPGTYELVVSKPDWKQEPSPMTVQIERPDQTIQVSVALTRSPSPPQDDDRQDEPG